MMAKNNILPIFVPHLGCPNHCVFCDQKRISGSSLPVCAALVTRQLEKAEAAGMKEAQLAFYGGSFTAVPPALQEELLGAAAPFLARGVLRDIRLSTRPDAVDGETLGRLKARGVSTIELGSQSMDDAVLARCGRGHAASDTVRAAALVKQAGFSLVLQMMTGLPGSDRDKDRETARRLIALGPDAVRIYPTVILRGTELEELWRRGDYREHTVAEAVALGADLLPMFQAAGIPVIRFGLNPSEELSGGEALAGAYHPALGELVLSELWRRRALELMKDVPAGAKVCLGVHPGRVSVMTGQKRANVTAICRDKGLSELTIKAVEAGREEILLLDAGI